MRIAFVHEYLNQFGGAERTLASLLEMFPHAPIYTLLYDEQKTRGLFKGRVIRTSFLQKFPWALRRHQLYPLLMPLAIEQFDFSAFDVVISLSASFAKGIITKPSTKHICYCLTPPRFLWDNSQQFVKEFGFSWLVRNLIMPLISYLRVWDQQAADRVDEFWSISNFVSARIQKYYRQPSRVIYPPVSTEFSIHNFQSIPNVPIQKLKTETFNENSKLEIKNYFLMVGRLVSYKKFDVAIEAFNMLGLSLRIVGIGPEMGKLRRMARGNIQFLGQISDEQLAEQYRGARALVFPQEEDFGIVPLEAMAAGRPVIAYRGGGALETIVENETGVFFDAQTADAIVATVRKFEKHQFDPVRCRAQAQKFSTDIFKQKILSVLNT